MRNVILKCILSVKELLLCTDEIDVGTKIKCNICQEYVKPGMKLYHCTLCPDSGFNACANCYTSFTHDEHAKGITSGIYPEYNPLGKTEIVSLF